MPSKLLKISYTGIFIALILAVGYSLAYVPNIELVTLMVFLSGYLMGIKYGVLIGTLGEFLFSALNPMGSGLLFPPMLFAQIIAMGLAGFAGGIMRSFIYGKKFKKSYVIYFGIAGFLTTLFYDIIVSLAYPISAGFDFKQTLGVMLSGVVFSSMHLMMNVLVFSTLLPVIVIRIDRSGIFHG